MRATIYNDVQMFIYVLFIFNISVMCLAAMPAIPCSEFVLLNSWTLLSSLSLLLLTSVNPTIEATSARSREGIGVKENLLWLRVNILIIR